MDRYGRRCSAGAWATITTGALLLLGACGGGGEGAGAVVTNPPAITVGTVTVALPSATLRAGDALTATAEVRSTAGSVLTGRAIAWTSSNAAVATVSSAGQVTGVAAGSATITATADGVSGSATLTVTSPPVGTIAVTTPTSQLSVARSMSAVVVVRDDRNAPLTGRALTWTSSDAAVATVDGTGLITGIAVGSATITASAEGKSGSVSITVVPPPVQTVRVALAVVSIPAGSSTAATATLQDDRGVTLTGRAVAWTSSNTTVATVSSAGQVTGVAPGAATITATAEGVSGSASVTVTPAPVGTITVTTSSAQVSTARTLTATAVVRDDRNNVLTGRALTWTSSDVAVATVDGTGLITGLALGSTTITASAEGKSGSVSITVVPPPVQTVRVALAVGSIPAGSSTAATATLQDDRGVTLTGRAVAWTSSNTTVATVSSAGQVTGVAPGAATITATAEGVSGSASVTVTPAPIGTITVTTSSAQLSTARTLTASVVVRDDRNNVLTGRALSWTSSDAAVATVDGSGLITGIAVGSATITASAEGKSGSVSITVVPPPVQTVRVALAAGSITQGSTTTATATLQDDRGVSLAGRSVSWSSNATSIATVDAAGAVIAVGVGSATITASSEGKSGSATLTVTPRPVATVVFTGALRQKVGDSYPMSITARTSDGSIVNRGITWRVRESGRATVSADGVVVPLESGSYTLVAVIDGEEWTASYTTYDWLAFTSGGSSFITLEADAQVSNRFGTPAYPSLTASCGSTGIFFVWVSLPHIITQNGIVAYSFDGGAAASDTWDELSPEFRTLWKRGSNNTKKAFAVQIAVSSRFSFAFGEFQSATRFAQWRVTGMATRLPALLTQCPSAIMAGDAPSAAVDETTSREAMQRQLMALMPGPRALISSGLDSESARRAAAGAAPAERRLLEAWPVWRTPDVQAARRVGR